jgi:hypothetical protein
MAIISVNNNSPSADPTVCEKLEDLVKTAKNFANEDEAQEAICALMQAGGSNRGAQGNLSITHEDPARTAAVKITLTLKEVREIISKNQLKITLRQYARARSLECFNVGQKYNIPGDLVKQLRQKGHQLSPEETFWASSFQMDSGSAPGRIKDLLIEHYNDMFK